MMDAKFYKYMLIVSPDDSSCSHSFYYCDDYDDVKILMIAFDNCSYPYWIDIHTFDFYDKQYKFSLLHDRYLVGCHHGYDIFIKRFLAV